MKKWTSLLLIFVFSTQALGSEIWVTTAGISTREKIQKITNDKQLKIKDAELTSLFEGLLTQPVSAQKLNDLFSLEELAQQTELDGDFSKAMALYQNLLEKLEKLPNVNGLQKITLAALIHVAHLASLLKYKDTSQLWLKAHAWAPQGQISTKEFSPAIARKFNEVKESENKITVEVKSRSEAWVFLDGKKLKNNNGNASAFVEPGHHQIAAIAPGTFWKVHNLEIKGIETKIKVDLPLRPAVEGGCHDPQLTDAVDDGVKVLAVFENEKCERAFADGTWYSVSGQKLESVTPVPPAPVTLQGGAAVPIAQNFWGELIKSPWFWVGASVVVVGGIALIKQNQHDDVVLVPSRTLR